MQTPKFSVFRASALALAISAAAVAGPALAQPGDEAGSERMLGKMTRHLDLDAEQQTSVAKLMDEAREAGAADRERMQEIKTQLRAQANSFDAGVARALADELGQITARSTYRMTATRAAMHELLDEEQRSKLEAMEAQRGEHGRKHGKGAGKVKGKGGPQEAGDSEASDS
ncbi:Spy/CpxP family protein refolding chaperone [Haliea sp. E1-2-M8]|uniref:Spy/CpxP family protein refolding chaperone n=1 Tax=Haliea sp. E1-2-M8 TaxID=3064706 RepID=UPI00271F20C2|nr:Spy/CpxP family protein refolding chaperone [Haliea sp. E1-2-M8]MDO8861210.1 Spy/CpxP family protein refolding chaperone [Haliea sp. E1-2-M8]